MKLGLTNRNGIAQKTGWKRCHCFLESLLEKKEGKKAK